MLSSLLKFIRIFKNKRRVKLINSLLLDMQFNSLLSEKVPTKFTLRNCTFHFQCNQTWESLEDVNIPNTKNCNVCNRLVYFVDSDKKLARAIKNNQCVAIQRSSNGMRKKRSGITVGVINPINFDEPTYLRKTK